jgi:hypothetical protein
MKMTAKRKRGAGTDKMPLAALLAGDYATNFFAQGGAAS